uniref:FAD-binding domain-containing protein n=1 Tax=Psilocybe cubensis TaxID=181762 RepID=A0A8H8CP50_PSICU
MEAQFLDIFVDHLPSGVAHFGKRLISYSKDMNGPQTTLLFEDGTFATCDVLVGADGIKSTIRSQMFREAAEASQDANLFRFTSPVWTGTIAYRGLIRAQDIPLTKDGLPHRTIKDPMMFTNGSTVAKARCLSTFPKKSKFCLTGDLLKHVVSYSISQGDIINVVTFASNPKRHGDLYEGDWVTTCSQDELLGCYSGWEPEVEQLLKCIRNPTRWAIHHILPLPFYYKDNVVLMGDAAHAMSPHQGAGAGQAIEDAYILSNLLATATRKSLPKVLNAYEAVRLPAANHVLLGSYESGMMYEFNSKYGENYEILGPAIQRQWDWIDRPSLEESLEAAIRLSKGIPDSRL